ncbi:MAG: radical SAM protein [Deltaproteobacteria bacterium]|nr:radical SAM protein [Deltaproteobacteria bacterium]
MEKRRRHVYGPVPSRRFGLSLGVDLVPHKVCNYDCVYCQLGPTRELVCARRDFFALDAMLADVELALSRGPRPDVLTLAGSGDPGLYRSLGPLIDCLHGLTDLPVVLLTNGGLLYRDDLAADALKADVLAPNLDAADEGTWRRVNRPCGEIPFARMREGLHAVCRAHSGIVRVEVMLVPGYNEACIDALAAELSGLRADRIDINTPVRPVPGSGLEACEPGCLDRARRAFGPRAEVIAAFRGGAVEAAQPDLARSVMDMLERRPCTLEDIAASLAAHPNEVVKILDEAQAAGRVVCRPGRDGSYFFAPRGGD